MKYLFVLALALVVACPGDSRAQFAAQKKASYVAIVKAVSNYKIGDEEIARDVDSLREDQRFNQNLQKMLGKLSNARNKDSRNKRVFDILEQAGKDIENTLRY